MPNIILAQNEYNDAGALFRVLNYALNAPLVGGYALDPDHAYRQMKMVKDCYHKADGNQLLHFVISFASKEAGYIDMEEMLACGFLASQLFGCYQTAYGLHTNTRYFHVHVVVNSVSFVDGRRYSEGLAGFWRLRNELQRLFPKSDVGIYRSFPESELNTYVEGDEESQLLRIG